MKFKTLALGALSLASVLVLAACGGTSNNGGGTDTTGTGDAGDKLSVAIITDTGGVDDQSFNQSAWEGLQAWGKAHDLSRGQGGYNFFQSETDADYTTNVNQAIQQGFGLIYGIGFRLHDAIADAAKANPDVKFAIIDDVIDGQDNVASITFADHEGGYLAGVAAAKASQSGKIGFLGGMEGEVIGRFEAGFRQGVHDTNPDAQVIVQYAGSFADPAQGSAIAQSMIAAGVDVIYQAAGATGAGAFNEARAKNQTLSDDELKTQKIWIIGVDMDQHALGDFKSSDGTAGNFVLVSTVKGVGQAVKEISNDALEGNFPGGKVTVMNLKNEGISLAMEHASPEIQEAVKAAQEKIISGEITVPETPDAVKDGKQSINK